MRKNSSVEACKDVPYILLRDFLYLFCYMTTTITTNMIEIAMTMTPQGQHIWKWCMVNDGTRITDYNMEHDGDNN